jgi:ABC-type multidrug transport system ATPase subunit
VLEASNLGFGYKNSQLVGGVNISMQPGDYLLVTGENGTGKTCFLRTIAGLEDRTSGDLNVSQPVVYVSTSIGLFENITVKRMWRLLSSWRGHGREAAETAYEWLKRQGVLNAKMRNVSGSERQICVLAAASLTAQSVVCCDEPFEGLDKDALEVAETIFSQLRASGMTLVLSDNRGLAPEPDLQMDIVVTFQGERKPEIRFPNGPIRHRSNRPVQ